jgi:predicted nuclease of predicted toxin-antitoxin system
MIVGVSVDTDPVEKVAAWIEEREFVYPIVLGDQDLAQRYGVIGYPTLVIIDPLGGIHTQDVGVLSRPELEAILDEIRLEARPAG